MLSSLEPTSTFLPFALNLKRCLYCRLTLVASAMRFTTAVAAAAASCTSTAIAYTPADTSGTDQLAAQGLANLKAYEKTANFTCSTETAHVRKEWDTLSEGDKKDYIDAVLCLQSKPAISGALAPGAKSRYDDFVATHINQTLSIHGTVWRIIPQP